MKLLSGAVERGQSSHMPAEVLERAGIGPCGTHNMQIITMDTSPPQSEPRLEKDSRHLEVLVLMSPGAQPPTTYLSSRRLPPSSRGNSSSGL